jgi:hypothetical protein
VVRGGSEAGPVGGDSCAGKLMVSWELASWSANALILTYMRVPATSFLVLSSFVVPYQGLQRQSVKVTHSLPGLQELLYVFPAAGDPGHYGRQVLA